MGGITSSGSLDNILSISSLSETFPGTITPPLEWSLISSLNFAFRLPLSGPWHDQQLSARMGLISRLNFTGSALAVSVNGFMFDKKNKKVRIRGFLISSNRQYLIVNFRMN